MNLASSLSMTPFQTSFERINYVNLCFYHTFPSFSKLFKDNLYNMKLKRLKDGHFCYYFSNLKKCFFLIWERKVG